MTIRCILAAALAAAAVAAPAAQARPADLRAPGAPASAQERPPQDLRSPDAADAAMLRSDPPMAEPVRPRGKALHPGLRSPGHPSEAGNVRPFSPGSDEPLSRGRDGVDWATLGLGVAGIVLFLGGVIVLASRSGPAPRPPLGA